MWAIFHKFRFFTQYFVSFLIVSFLHQTLSIVMFPVWAAALSDLPPEYSQMAADSEAQIPGKILGQALGGNEPLVSEVSPMPQELRPVPKWVVLELNTPESDPKVVEKVADTLRDELLQQAGILVLDKAETSSFFRDHPDILQRIDTQNPLNRYIDQAEQLYLSMDLKDAIGVLSNTIETYRSAHPPLTENFLLVDAYLFLGNIYLGDKKISEAKNIFKEAVLLDPDRELTTEDYSPDTIAYFVQSKEEFLSKAKTSKVDIFSAPKDTEIYLNGVKKGLTPVQLERLPQGEHFVLAQKPGYKPVAQKINVKDNYTRVKLELEKDIQEGNQIQGLWIKDLHGVEAQVQMAGKVGSSMKVDKVILVSVEEIGYNHKISARMIDMKYYASYKPAFVEVLDLPQDTRPATAVIAKDLTHMAQADMGSNPKKYADSEVIVIGKKKKKSFWKSPLLWSLVGVLAAGGAATGIMVGRSGNSEDDSSTTISVGGSAQRTP